MSIQDELRWGVVAHRPTAYGAGPPAADPAAAAAPVPPGHKRLRILARDVHHFGWSISPDYRYEGAWYLRPNSARAVRVPAWDSVAVHVLYQPGDEATWGRGQVVARTNVTLRWLEPDRDSVLAYAPEKRIALVMLFSQEMTERAEADMRRLTEGLVEAALGLGGSYYLPYRPHATLDQFRRAYPRWEEFAALKREVDPGLVLRNGFWDRYLAAA